MIVLDNITEVQVDSSSKGNQRKFYSNGVWIKLDSQNCYEGLAENFVSKFCECIYDFPYVQYESSKFEYNDNEYTGCFSRNMYNRQDIVFVSFRSLLKQWGIPQNIFFKEDSVAVNMQNVINLVYKNIGLNLSDYFKRLLMLDCLIINEDRHIMNIGVCYCRSNGLYYEAPCFDNGSSLFCTNWTYRKRKTLEENIEFAKSVARPFSKFYDKQLQALLDLGFTPLRINRLAVERLLKNYYNPLYSRELNERVKVVLVNRLNYYQGKAFVYV